MREHGHTDLSHPAVDQWRNVPLSGYAHRISRYRPASFRKKAFAEMGEDLAKAIQETQVENSADAGGRTLELPKTMKNTIRLLLEDTGFSEGWHSELSRMSREEIKSICSTAGLPEPVTSTGCSTSDC
jgi:hypothetical protein